ncbi:TPA: threonine--tRNA ligase [Bacillus thuringiensis]|uniref:Threonine--tRNA ligase n=5 Tax=Bacillus cereus group TaxID=86661 RepID=A0A9X7LVT0_BACCE|nr:MULTISPECIES: threonine--tRNA ligase [Bacillus]HCF54733.1 threonine--tRNA ligase [Bacillus sp. (in: firmicutes)]AGE78186.1 threonyl-tRNA synthetase [Bacillus thuringiensis serovar kurstaki str. HD73]AHX18461.1 threonine--tRNA ligase [Bacillus bombysepticus str. Wang]AIE33662.1 threonyl-tRNA ligase [Bacillus thuringiensis serovar kurstaki str. HD-1]AIM32058.1 threonyl-tRNA synthetase [Bacillus thuringiensis serovar kurstaki str. YBT-1520]
MKEQMIEIKFPDGSVKEFVNGVTLEEIAGSISSSLKKKAVAGKVNDGLYDLRRNIEENAEVEIITIDSNEGVEIARHSAAHILAQAVKRLYGDINLGVGPVIENGFYYDMDLPSSVNIEDLRKIEKEMKKIINENIKIERVEVSREEAAKLFQEMNDRLKLELLEAIPSGESVTLYKQGEFVDLCRGPHLPSTGYLKAFQLTHVSGAYWRGDSNNQVLQRIYGVAFSSQKELEEYLHFVEEAAKRNHRKLGSELELFMFSEEAPGMPFYLPKGQMIRNELEAFLREIQKEYKYQEVRTPFMMNQEVWERSGHWGHYKDNMYFSEVDNKSFALKPMNCPGHMLMFKNKLHSYRELPIRMCEFGQVHRHEFSGALNGLLRVRTFCQDDAHLFVTPKQIEDEIKSVMAQIDYVYKTFGFEYEVELSTRPEDSMGDDKLWEQAEAALENVLQSLNYKYRLNEGDGAFYGPKIDFHIKDALNRSHQCGTIQLDFQMPEKFDLNYIDENNEKKRPVVIHRAVLGSLDRFLAILIEHFGGAFPAWVAPVQVKVIPVSNAVHEQYANEIAHKLAQAGVRVEQDARDEKLGYKIREAQMQKVPYVLVIGDKEMENGAVNVRKYGEEKSEVIALDVFVATIEEEIKNRKY